MKIEELVQCSVCHGRELISKRLMIEDFYGEYSLKDVKICKECDTLHYIHRNTVFYEFSLKISKNIVRDEYEI